MNKISPKLQSFIPVSENSDFPIQNLPYGVFRRCVGANDRPRIGVAIGEMILDLAEIDAAGLLDGTAVAGQGLFTREALNAFLALGRPVWRETRARITQLLRADEPALRDNPDLRDRALVPMTDAEMLLPVHIGDYTDFYSSKEHATHVGAMFRDPDKALLPNYRHLPVAYHGRASSVVLSGTDIRRPLGQILPPGQEQPIFAPSQQLDFELEMGFFIGPGNALGEPIRIERAPEHIFGMVLVNDWSARDIQRWEYQPLGPFLSKNLGTSISPWVVTLEALASFRVASPVQEPEPLPYLRRHGDWAFDIHLEALLQTPNMAQPQRIARSNYRYLYWGMCQQVAHHSISGCNLRPGDLLASGTISGPAPESRGSLLELTWRGEQPLALARSESRTFLEDGDTTTLRGWCQGPGYRVGFGEVSGTVLPARHDE